MSYQDRTLSCQDCGQSFTFTADEQSLFAQKGYTNDPKRCPTCRAARRTESTSSSGMGGGMGSGGYGRPAQRREMFPAVCAQCGKQTQVPFRPSGTRPVYCSDCFSRQGASSRR
ncbi:MAG: zinc-ribbon domain containing protein [Chloroflexi bacterium]|nr:zinc-ribbon domain containing protein [Chloroflexota bacterium]